MSGLAKGTVKWYAGLLKGLAKGGGSLRTFLGELVARGAHSSQFRATAYFWDNWVGGIGGMGGP